MAKAKTKSTVLGSEILVRMSSCFPGKLNLLEGTRFSFKDFHERHCLFVVKLIAELYIASESAEKAVIQH